MRKFYIFNINEEFKILNSDDGYSLYKQMENIHNLDKDNFYNAVKVYETIAHKLDKNKINEELNQKYSENYFYTKYQNTHMINNYYRAEESKLTINSAYLILETNVVKSTFLKDLKNKCLFACDFDNKDYFWIDKLTN